MYYPLVRRASLVRTDQVFHAHGNELVRKKEFDVARWNDAFTRREQSYLRKLRIFVVVEGTAIDSPRGSAFRALPPPYGAHRSTTPSPDAF
jgi:hypothetical protein